MPGEILIVAVDVHKARNYAHCELDGLPVKTVGQDFSFVNCSSGFSLLFTRVSQRLKETNLSSCAVVLEPTGPYWKVFGCWLRKINWPLYLVSTEQVYHQRIADDPKSSKTDKLDPKTIAKLFRDGKTSLARLPEGKFQRLRHLHREHVSLSTKLAREKIQLKAFLAETNPEFLSFFSSPLGKVSERLLSLAPTPKEIVDLGIEALFKLFKTYGNGIMGTKKATALFTLMQNSCLADQPQQVKDIINRFLDRICLYRKQLQKIDSQLLSLSSPHLEKLITIPGVSEKLAGRFLAELGDPTTIKSPKALVSLCGICPKEWSSGSSIHKKAHLTKKGNPHLRKLIYLSALSCIRYNPELVSYYQGLLEKGKVKMVALFAVARKLLHIIYYVLNGAEYDPKKVRRQS